MRKIGAASTVVASQPNVIARRKKGVENRGQAWVPGKADLLDRMRERIDAKRDDDANDPDDR